MNQTNFVFSPNSQIPLQICPFGNLMVPSPSIFPSLNVPQYSLLSFHTNFPSPLKRPFQKPPVYSPNKVLSRPIPTFLLSSKSPSQIYYYPRYNLPLPFILPSTNSPSNIFPSFHLKIPFPYFNPSTKFPQYIFPSLNIYFPCPLGLLFFHYPSQNIPEDEANLPFPSSYDLCTSPLQQDPSLNISNPFVEQASPSLKNPSKQWPSGKYIFPFP